MIRHLPLAPDSQQPVTPVQVLTATLDYLKDVVGMQLSQFPLPDINKVQRRPMSWSLTPSRWWGVTRPTSAASSNSSWESPSTVTPRRTTLR